MDSQFVALLLSTLAVIIAMFNTYCITLVVKHINDVTEPVNENFILFEPVEKKPGMP